MTVGQNIRRCRKEIGLTQKELAEKLGFPPQRIGQYETGVRNPKAETLMKIASALGVSAYELVDLGEFNSDAYIRLIELEVDIKYLKIEIDLLNAHGQSETAKEKEILLKSKIKQVKFLETGLEYDTKETLEKISPYIPRLNKDGQQEAIKRVAELTEIPRYQREPEETPQLVEKYQKEQKETPQAGADPAGAE